MKKEDAIRLAEEIGFSHWGLFPVSELRFLPEVREMCEVNRCGQYGKSWSCPPACGTLEECRERAMGFSWGILLQTTAEMEDSFDLEAMMDAEQRQKVRFGAFCDRLEEEICLPLGAGTCTVCAKCTYPDAPCRFPERLRPSMEAFGLQVTDVCHSADIPYYYGPNTITYSSCVLFA